jgi:hypothetical protein
MVSSPNLRKRTVVVGVMVALRTFSGLAGIADLGDAQRAERVDECADMRASPAPPN